MILKSLKYTRFEGEPRQWKIVGKDDQFSDFGNLNLLVGKNASGKSRTLTVIRTIADLFAGRITIEETNYPSEKFELIFACESMTYEYHLNYKKREIIEEVLKCNGKEVLNFQKGIVNHVNISIKGQKKLSVRLKDEKGDYYFKPIVEWGINLKSFLFSNQYEKNHLLKDYRTVEKINELEYVGVLIYNFNKGVESFGESFTEEVKNCMARIGYSITDIQLRKTKSGYELSVEEYGLYQISQREMSQGMFRALAFFIQLTFACMSNYSLCVLFDDIGEGLDYDRARDFISIFIKKVNNSNMQFLMTTNDRNVMNKIPLKYWTVIDRKKDESIFYNYNNSKDIFEDFRYTGLNNFDFLATDFYKKGFSDTLNDEVDTEIGD